MPQGIVWVLFVIASFTVRTAHSLPNDELQASLLQIQNFESLSQQNDALQRLLEQHELDVNQQMQILRLKGSNYANSGQLKEAIIPFQRALSLAESEPDKAELNRLLGMVFFYLETPTESIEHYRRALKYQLTINNQKKAADLENNIALAYEKAGLYSKALDYYQLAEPRYQFYGTEQDILDIHINRAGLFAKLELHDDANTIYNRLIEEHIEKFDANTKALLYSNAAVIKNSLKQHQGAIDYLTQAKIIFNDLEDRYHLASTYLNLADTLILLNRYQQARIEIAQAANISVNLNNPTLNFTIPYLYARIAIKMKEPVIALEQINQAIDVATQAEQTHNLQQAYEQAIIIYAVNNLVTKAYEVKKKYAALTNSIEKRDAQKRLTEEQAYKERDQLANRVSQLENETQIQQLAFEKSKQQRVFFIIASLLSIILIVVAQRRAHERRATQQLEALVASRTAELQKTSEELRKASLVKSKFLANMSHEIRTPLTAIIGHSEVMDANHYDAINLKKDLNIINNNGKHLLDLINDILDISRIEENKLELDVSEFNLTNLIDEIGNMFTTLAKQKKIEFNICNELTPDFAISADPFRLKQIILNLCSNAIKFTDQGSVTLSVRETYNGVRFNVIDTGIGMESKQLEAIFDSFTQGDNSISRRFGGSGLGLCLSEQLANLMHGSISVTSKVNEGSEFTLHLTVAKSRLAPIKTKPSTMQTAMFEGEVLIAEDHDDNRELIARILTQLGLHVTAVSNGLEAVEKCKETRFDLVLLDIQMPVLDGLGALMQLKKSGFSQPIVAITANTMQHEINSYLEHGFSDHIKKPLEQDNFITTLGKYLSQNNKSQSRTKLEYVTMGNNRDLIARFVSNLDEDQRQLTRLFERQHWQELQSLLHKIKGAAAMFQFHSIAEAASYFEKALKYNDTDAFNEAYEGILFAMTNADTESSQE